MPKGETGSQISVSGRTLRVLALLPPGRVIGDFLFWLRARHQEMPSPPFRGGRRSKPSLPGKLS